MGINYILIGAILIAVNKTLYSVISIKALKNFDRKKILFYVLLFSLPIIIIIPLISPFLKDFLVPAILVGILTSSMCCLAFLKAITFKSIKNIFYWIGLTLLALVDFLFVYEKFVYNSIIIYVIMSIINFSGKYLICTAMIRKK